MAIDPSLPFSRFGTAPVSPRDDRDHAFFSHSPVLATSELPDEVGKANMRAYPSIRDQGQEGSCTGHGFRSVKQTQERRSRKRPSTVPEFGPRGIYTLAKQIGGYPDEEGAYLRDVLKAVALYGTAREKDWPYVATPGNDGKPQDVGKPTNRWLANTKRWPIGAYSRTYTLEQILTALETIGPVYMAMDLNSNFFDADSEGVIPPPSGQVIGGHCMAIIGAVQSTRRFYVANSWGPGWGKDGFCWIDFDHFLSKSRSEAWAVHDV